MQRPRHKDAGAHSSREIDIWKQRERRGKGTGEKAKQREGEGERKQWVEQGDRVQKRQRPLETDTEGESAVQRPTQRERQKLHKDAGSGPQP